ncbi:MAG: hypothetical protein ACOYMA_01965 [Bacteroidia bacterium]
MKTIYTLSILLLFSACSFHTGNVSSGAHIDCPMIYIATGAASTTRFLEIGGFNKDALIVQAKNDLYRKFPYKKGIKLSNFSVDYKNTYFLLFHTTYVTVSADVYDCNSFPENDSIMNKIPSINGFSIGDTVLHVVYGVEGEVIINKGCIVNHAENFKVFIKDIGGKKALLRSCSNIYKATPEPSNINNFGFNVGEIVDVNILNIERGIKSKKKCTIKGINHEKAIVEFVNIKNVVTTQVIEKQLLRK